MTVNVMFRIVDVVDYAASQDVYLFFTNWSNYLAAIVSVGTLYCIIRESGVLTSYWC